MFRRAFAISAFLVVLMIGAIAFDNYNREWKAYQRDYYYELAREETGELTWLDRSKVELELGLIKVVTEETRSADMCMTCHLNTGVDGFEEQPLVNLMDIHPDYIINQYPLDQVGCTACHGGKPLALTVHHAHEGLRDAIEPLFLLKVKELNAPDWITRQKAIETIRWMVRNDFGYAQDAPEAERQASIDRILTWWNLNKDTFFTQGFGDRESPFRTINPLQARVDADSALSPAGEVLEYVNNNSCISCHTSLYTGRIQEAQAADNTESLTAIQQQLDHIRLWAEIDLGDITLSDEAFDHIAKEYTCQACHGPGQKYFSLMQKGYSLMVQGRSIEAADLLGRASELARENARRNLGSAEVWELTQALAAKSAGVEPTSPMASPTPEADGGAAQIERGMQLAQSNGCTACHTADGSSGVGPTWKGLYMSERALADGSTVVADEAYLHESIVDPNGQVVQGYSAGLMPSFGHLSDDDLDAIIAYIISLADQ